MLLGSIPEPRVAELGLGNIEYVVAGGGPHTLVLINGAGGPIEGWHAVFRGLTELGVVIAYNRPGLGRSSKPGYPQTGEVMVTQLRSLLRHVNATPPYVLVAHSLGGLIANLYARTCSSEVSAIVFLDATTPEDVVEMPAHETSVQRGLNWLIAKVVGKDPNSETEHTRATVAQIAAAGTFPGIPVTVLSGGKPDMAWAMPKAARETRTRNQKRLAALSPRGERLVAERSGHFPQLTEPAVVIAAVRAILSRVDQ